VGFDNSFSLIQNRDDDLSQIPDSFRIRLAGPWEDDSRRLSLNLLDVTSPLFEEFTNDGCLAFSVPPSPPLFREYFFSAEEFWFSPLFSFSFFENLFSIPVLWWMRAPRAT